MSEQTNNGEVFHPSNETLEKVQLKDRALWDQMAETDYLGFWESFARELHWFRSWDKVLDDRN